MKYIFIMATALSFMMLWMFFFMGASYYAAIMAITCAVSALFTTMYNE